MFVAILILLESFLQFQVLLIDGVLELKSQPLFYWNPFCNTTPLFLSEEVELSQSLFYWNPFCNFNIFLVFSGDYKSQSLFYWNPFCNRSKIYLIFPITCRKVAFLPSPCANIKNKLHLINICTTNIYNYTVKYRNKQPNIQNTKTNFKDYP